TYPATEEPRRAWRMQVTPHRAATLLATSSVRVESDCPDRDEKHPPAPCRQPQSERDWRKTARRIRPWSGRQEYREDSHLRHSATAEALARSPCSYAARKQDRCSLVRRDRRNRHGRTSRSRAAPGATIRSYRPDPTPG